MSLADWLPPRDPRTLDWFGAGDWKLLTYVLGAYVGAVKVLLPQFMANRKAFQLLGPIRLYNLCLVAINIYFLYHLGRSTYFGGGYNLICQGIRINHPDLTPVRFNYLYMFVRIFEFLDTVFFVLRKKFNQASILNISHHCISVFMPWYGLAYGIDGQICLPVLFNMAVHVIMYSYYFLASFPAVQPYLGWKKYLTLVQIVQFVVGLTHMMIPLFYECGYPKQNSLLVVSFYLYFLLMFAAFYGSAYRTRARDRAGAKRGEDFCTVREAEQKTPRRTVINAEY